MRDIELRQYEPPLPNDMIKLLDDKDITKVQENIIFIYHILFHIFLFSVFESIFFCINNNRGLAIEFFPKKNSKRCISLYFY